MKLTTLNKFFLLLLLIASFSCESILEVEPEGTIAGDALKDAESIQKALTGAYYNLGGINDGANRGELLGGDFIVIPTLLAHLNGKEITWSSVNAPQYSVFADSKTIPSVNDRVAANWIRAYETISSVNNILKNANKISDGNERNRIEGEALAIRSILYFEMVRLWGPQYSEETKNTPVLPLLTEPILSVGDINETDMSTVQQVYDRVQEDLESASFLLAPFGKNGTALSYYACQAYLSRLFMQKGDYPAAVTAANNILNTTEYTLAPTPTEAFNNTNNSSEDIFAIQQTLANNAGDRSAGAGITAFYSSLSESGLGVLGVFEFTFNSEFYPNRPNFSDADLRATIDVSVTPSTPSTSINSAFYQNQYNNLEGLLSSTKYIRADHVIPVVRLAEIFLNRAESIFETDTLTIDQIALNDLNAVRTRSGLSSLQISDFNNEPNAFYDSLIIEKKREMIYEGSLLHDLRRRRAMRGDNDIIIGDLIQRINPLSDVLILPVPQAEKDANSD